MKLNKLIQAIKGIDIYGVPVGVNFKNNEIYKTSFGAFVSAIIFIFIVLQCYFSVQDLLNKKNPQVITSEQYVRNPERMVFDNVQQVIMMGFNTISSQYIYDPSIIQASATLSSVNKVFNETTQQYDTQTQINHLKIRPCSMNDIKVEKLKSYFMKLPLSSLFCFDDNQQIYVEGDYSGDFYSRVDVYFNQCVNSTQVGSVICQSQQKIDKVLSKINFLVYMMDKILDPSQYETPFDYQGVNIQTQASNQQSQAYTSYFENYYIQSDVGLIWNDIKQVRDFRLAGMDTTMVYSNPNLVMQYTLRPYKNKQILMQRKYTKFTDLLAQIGGVLKFLTVFGFIICHPYAKLNLTKEIINNVFDFEENQNVTKQGKQDVDTEQKEKYQDNQKNFQLDLISMKNLNFNKQINNQLNNQAQQQKTQENTQLMNQTLDNQIQQKAKFKTDQQKINSIQHNPQKLLTKKKKGDHNQSQIGQSFDQPNEKNQNTQYNIYSFQKQKSSQNQVINQNKDEKQKENDIKSLSQEDKFKNIIVSRIKQLINPLKQKFQLKIKDYLIHFLNCFQNKTNLMQEGIQKIQHRLDIQNILCQLQEVEKLKKIVLDEDQIKLFEILPRPILKNSLRQARKSIKNNFFDTVDKSEEQKVYDAYNSLCNILKKQKKSQRDLQLIQLLDNNMYLSLQQQGILSNKSEMDIEIKYQQDDRILENPYLFDQPSFLNKTSQLDSTQQEQQEDINFFNVNFDTQEEVGVKSDFYFKFHKMCNKNTLNLS
ncbi:hypothetical protein ABPG74_006902 [Tetrahymena malaccensis]